MRSLIFFLFLLTACTRSSQDRETFIGKTIFFSGQSNATNIGTAKVSETIDPSVTMYDGKSFLPAQNPIPVPMMNRVHQGVSIWPALGKAYRELTGSSVRLIGFANSGQPIEYWQEGQVGWREISRRLSSFCTRNSMFVWYQGESDSTPELRVSYEKKLFMLIRRVRQICEGIPFIVVELGDVDPEYAKNLSWDFESIRSAQRNAVARSERAVLVSAKGLPLQDVVHLNSESLIQLGRSIAQAIVKAGW